MDKGTDYCCKNVRITSFHQRFLHLPQAQYTFTSTKLQSESKRSQRRWQLPVLSTITPTISVWGTPLFCEVTGGTLWEPQPMLSCCTPPCTSDRLKHCNSYMYMQKGGVIKMGHKCSNYCYCNQLPKANLLRHQHPFRNISLHGRSLFH